METIDAQYSSAVVYRNVMVSMRDGAQLATDIYLPSVDGAVPIEARLPVLLARSPYGKNPRESPTGAQTQGLATYFVQHGYAVAVQNTRGTFASEGRFRPLLDDSWGRLQDGYDTVVWLASQTWCNGHVGTFGSSYLGATQILLASARPPGLVTGFVGAAVSDEFNSSVYVGGAMDIAHTEGWTYAMAKIVADREPAELADRILSELHQNGVPSIWGGGALEPSPDLCDFLPLRDVPALRLIRFWQDWLDAWEKPWGLRNSNVADHLQDIDVPMFHWTGWYDMFLRTTIEQYKGIATRADNPNVRAGQRLLIGPWQHGPSKGNRALPNAPDYLDFDVGPTSAAFPLPWFDHLMKGKAADPIFEHNVIIYVMGENRWRAEKAWPLPDAKMTRYYLHSNGRANGIDGNGGLSTSPPKDEAPDHYIYDPNNPVATRGGPAMNIGGMFEQSDLGRRHDILTFTTPPLDENVEVTGEIRCTLYAASSAEDTDWTVKLVDVHPDGKAYNLANGILRARFRHSRSRPQALTPGAIESYDIDVWATSNVFKKGHRIRVEVSSSNFPHFDRNTNKMVDPSWATKADFVAAHQSIYHDAAHPSSIDLPIIPPTREREWIEPPFPTQVGSPRGSVAALLELAPDMLP